MSRVTSILSRLPFCQVAASELPHENVDRSLREAGGIDCFVCSKQCSSSTTYDIPYMWPDNQFPDSFVSNGKLKVSAPRRGKLEALKDPIKRVTGYS